MMARRRLTVDVEEPANSDDQLRRIATMLRLSRNGGFALLSYDAAEQLDGWLAAIMERLGEATFVRVPLPPSGTKIASEIDALATRSAVTTAPLPIFVIAGIEQLAPEARTLLVTNLNRMRTHLAGVAYPLLFCGDPSVLATIVHEAPDLFDRIGLWADLRGLEPPELAPAPIRSAEQRYREAVVRRLRLVEFRGILSINKPVALPLTEFYVPLQADQRIVIERVPERLPGDFFRTTFEPETMPPERRYERRVELRPLAAAEAVRDHRTLVVLGDPGAGKSTLLRSLALAAAEGEPERVGLPPNERSWLPLLVACADYATALAKTHDLSLLAFIEQRLTEQYELTAAPQLVQAALAEHRALLLFDGLDEVPASERASVARAVNMFVAEHCRTAGNRAVVSSRIVGYDAAPLDAAEATITLRDFGDEQIAQFLNTWCVAYERFARGDGAEAQAAGEAQATQLVSELQSNTGARRLAGNPLLLTIMALIQRQGVKMPERRVKLYDIACQTLIETWNRARSLSDVALLSMPDPQLTTALLGELALWMQQHDYTSASAADLLPVLTAAYRQRGTSQPEAAASAFLYDVQRFSGLLVERGPDQYSFLHLTFQEYFAARSLATRYDAEQRWQIIKPRLHDSRWRETILLTAGELGIRMEREQEVSDLVQRILDATPAPTKLTLALFERRRWWWLLRDQQIAQIEEHKLKRNLLLAGETLADDVGMTYALAQELAQRLNTLFRTSDISQQSDQTAAVIKRLPKSVRSEIEAPLVAALRDPNDSVRWSAANTLGQVGQGSEAVLAGLLAALCDPDKYVRSRAADALGRLGQASEPVLAGLLAALRDPYNKVRQSAATALGKLNSNTPAVLDALVAALRDEDRLVSFNAARALGNLSNSTPTVFDTLIAILRDEDEGVRLTAARALGQLRSSTPAVIDALVAALRDKDEDVRLTAARALGNLGNGTPAVIDALVAALRDKDEGVRLNTALALGDLGSSMPPVLDALVAALRDEDEDVRLTAARALGNLGSTTPAVADTLVAALRDQDEFMSRIAAAALGQLGSSTPAIIDTLVAAVRDQDEGVRVNAARALGNLGSSTPAVLDALVAALRDQDEGVRLNAARALGNLGSITPAVLDALVAALRDQDEGVRLNAAKSLERLGQASEAVIAGLLKALNDVGSFMNIYAAVALTKLGQNTRQVRLSLLANADAAYTYRVLLGEDDEAAAAP